MITTINKKKLAQLYNMSDSNISNYLQPHLTELKKLGTKRTNKKEKVIHSQNYNSRQLDYLVKKVFGDSPEGYEFNGKKFIKLEN